MKVKILRLTDPTGPQQGVMMINDVPMFATIELPWDDNKRMVSSIPEGRFFAERHFSPRFGDTFEVKVPGRDLILFHIANTVADLHGCVGIGITYGELAGEPAVVSSRDAFKRFMQKMDGIKVFELEVVSVYDKR